MTSSNASLYFWLNVRTCHQAEDLPDPTLYEHRSQIGRAKILPGRTKLLTLISESARCHIHIDRYDSGSDSGLTQHSSSKRAASQFLKARISSYLFSEDAKRNLARHSLNSLSKELPPLIYLSQTSSEKGRSEAETSRSLWSSGRGRILEINDGRA